MARALLASAAGEAGAWNGLWWWLILPCTRLLLPPRTGSLAAFPKHCVTAGAAFQAFHGVVPAALPCPSCHLGPSTTGSPIFCSLRNAALERVKFSVYNKALACQRQSSRELRHSQLPAAPGEGACTSRFVPRDQECLPALAEHSEDKSASCAQCPFCSLRSPSSCVPLVPSPPPPKPALPTSHPQRAPAGRC